ncbi:MAG: exosortase family protein XrtF [Flavobacterium sp.]|jgi:exosortase family protein XrtF|nr:exosortase family protein XrtF [Flavobacterium sp.]
MIDFIKSNKPFFVFLAKFLSIYLGMSLLYAVYLNRYDSKTFEVDSFTKQVSIQTKNVLIFFGEDAAISKHPSDASYKLALNGKVVARVIEGCNALSVMILFAAFVFAFSATFKKTSLFVLFGAILIHVLNIFRIVLLTLALYHYPEHKELLHGTIFPLFIYGVVFLLWIIWLTKFSGYVTKNIAE